MNTETQRILQNEVAPRVPQSSVRISVVMATFNGEKYLLAQLESILTQLAEDDELIVTDDHSTDGTLALIEAMHDARIKVVKPAVARGPIANFEHGLSHASREIVVLADQDDVWLPGRVATIRAHFVRAECSHDLLVLDSRVVDEKLSTIEPSVFRLLDAGAGLLKNVYRNTYIGCHMAFKRALLEVALPFPRKIPMHDVWLGLVSERVGPVTFLEGPSMLFRRTGKNFTKARYSWLARLTWRANLSVNLLKFMLRRRPGGGTRAGCNA